MYRKNLLVLSIAVAAAACTDSPTSIPSPYTGAAPRLVELNGTVAVEASYAGPIVNLMMAGGERVRLEGSEAARLTSVDGAEVLVRGDWARGAEYVTDDYTPLDEDASAFGVVEFVVTAVDGHAALDGVLVETEDGYALRLAGGGMHTIADPPAELTDHVGERVWVTGMDEDRLLRFGVIP